MGSPALQLHYPIFCIGPFVGVTHTFNSGLVVVRKLDECFGMNELVIDNLTIYVTAGIRNCCVFQPLLHRGSCKTPQERYNFSDSTTENEIAG
jgi:hypothetical protein